MSQHWPPKALIWLRAFPAWSFSLSFPLLTAGLREDFCAKVGAPVLGIEVGAQLPARGRDCQYLAPQVIDNMFYSHVPPTFFKRSFNVHQAINNILSYSLLFLSSLNTYSSFPILAMPLNVYFWRVPPGLCHREIKTSSLMSSFCFHYLWNSS